MILPQANLFSMFDLTSPGGVGGIGGQVVSTGLIGPIQLAAGNDGLLQHSFCAGQIQCDGIEGCKHTHIGNDRQIVVVIAVAAGAHIPHQADVEMGAAIQHCFGVFSDLVAQQFVGILIGGMDRLDGTLTDAAATTGALCQVNVHLAVILQNGCAMGAAIGADTATYAVFLVYHGTASGVHFLFALKRTAAHADILQRTAEAGSLVTLEMVQGDENVGIHYGTADLGFLHVLATHYGDSNIVSALQAVGNNDLAAGGVGGEAV